MNAITKTYTPQSSREKILIAGFQEMHQHGYQGMRIDAILTATGMAKGALYHHFPNKVSLAYAIIDELLHAHMKQQFETHLALFDDPIEGLCQLFSNWCDEQLSETDVCLGCPVNNLAQEMSGLDDGFKDRINNIYHAWIDGIKERLIDGQKKGYVDKNIDVDANAQFIVCAKQGIAGMAKTMQSKELMQQQLKTLCQYIQGLRAK